MNPRLRSVILFACGILPLAQAANARPASYVPDTQWDRKSWKCKEGSRSSVEIEGVRIPTATVADLRVSDLQIDARKVDADSIDGLNDFLSQLGGIQSISGHCGWTGEFIFIRGFVRDGPDLRVTREKQFFIPYSH
jgi:hypothetical protein